MSGVQTFTQPDYSSQDGTTYPTYIDRAIAIFKRMGDWFAPHQQDQGSPSPDLTVRLDAGWLSSGTTLTEVAAQTVSGFTIPAAGYLRIDRVVVDASTGVASRVAGVAETVGSPTAFAPAIPAGKIPICQIAFTSADTALLNAMITDERAFPTSGGVAASQAEVDAGTSNTVFLTPGRNLISMSVEQAWSSGASLSFTGMPAGTRRIIVAGKGITTNGTSGLMVQLRDAGGPENAGYTGGVTIGTAITAFSTGFGIMEAAVAANTYDFVMVLQLENAAAFRWSMLCVCNEAGAGQAGRFSAGTKALSAELDGVVLTTVGGTDTGDGGVVTVIFER